MKIGIVSDHFYPELGGIQDSVAELSRELGVRGHTVHIWAPRPSRHNFHVARIDEKEIDLGTNVSVHRVFSVPIPSSTMQSRFTLPYITHRPIFRSCDVVHIHSFIGLGLAALFTARRRNTHRVGTNHWVVTEFADYLPKRFNAPFRSLSARYVTWFYNQCMFVSAPSQTVLSERVAAGINSKSSVISNPIDTHTFSKPSPEERVRLRREFDFDGPVIACVGRLAPEKKNDVVVRAFAEVLKTHPTAVLVFAGHGSFEPTIRSLCAELSVEKNVRFLGNLSKDKDC